ncbi:putative homogentisate phytyltransferase [Helianthus anomalus]
MLLKENQVLSIISISLLAVQRLSDLTPSFFLGVLQAVIGGCLANLYVVGLNQLSDIEIDKVNKPYLPLASGELSVKAGIRITSLYAILVCKFPSFISFLSFSTTITCIFMATFCY